MSTVSYSIVLTGLAGLLHTAVVSQTPLTPQPLSIDSAIHLALTHNRQAVITRLEEQAADARYRQTDAVYLPQVTVNYTAYTTNDPLAAFGFKLEQRNITANDFNPALLNHPGATGNYNAGISVKQPLVNPDLWLARQGARLQVAAYAATSQRTRQYLVYTVQQACVQLQLAYEVTTVLEQACRSAQEAYRFTNNRYQQGLLQQSDVLNTQVQVANMEGDLAKAKSGIANASDNISLLTGQPPGTNYRITDSLSLAAPLAASSQVPAQRADFTAMQKNIDASAIMIRSGKMSYWPRLNAFGNYQYNDSHLAGFNAGSYMAGIQLSWDVFDGNRARRQVATQTIEKNKMEQQFAQQKSQAQVELNKALRDLSDAGTGIGQQTLAVAQSAEALRIIQNRYAQGLVSTTDLLAAQTQLAQRQLALAQARYNEQMAKAWIQLLTTTSNPQ